MIKYLTFSVSIAFISWIVGMIITALLIKTDFYQKKLQSLNFIKNEKINEMIGLAPFKWMIMHSFFKYFNPKLSGNKKILGSELVEYRKEMTTAELNHLFAFGFVVIFILIKIFNGLYLSAGVMLLVNILMNLYPSLLQQQNKRRIDRYLQILHQRSS
ncbi:hypothetical protein [Pedobacter mucosus]|uniref:glycosyl-4,4'-diaponeurosporenoate acyltransferase CrtO family protein n=1 Tax=Pedobacter mucosus TaxID=2895286 RepID=UPI001EE48D55|nr:hypothetical protein [Pedobacter mucosus]UKT63045.1 hypothetical protein LOK61_14860 [Pedobacter mucosus]